MGIYLKACLCIVNKFISIFLMDLHSIIIGQNGELIAQNQNICKKPVASAKILYAWPHTDLISVCCNLTALMSSVLNQLCVRS